MLKYPERGCFMSKTETEVVIDIKKSVELARNGQKRLKSSTFWKLFGIKKRTKETIERILKILHNEGIAIEVISDCIFGQEKKIMIG